MVASDQDLKHLATRATCMYLWSVLRNKKMKIEQAKLEKFAESMGLAQIPEEALKESGQDSDDEGNGQMPQKRRRQSPLERLKEKIKQKKLEKKNQVSEDNGWEEMEDDLARALGGEQVTKKLSKFERLEKRLDHLRAIPQTEEEAGEDEPLFEPKTSDTVPVSTPPKYTQAELKALAALKKQKLRVRADGTFHVRGAGGMGSAGNKIVFEDDDNEE
jgi:ATP-dependent RNA helicase DDX10/DBP4